MAEAARAAAKEAKAERARAMDALTELLLERAEYRMLARQALPYLWVIPATSEALADRALMPKDIARQLEVLLELGDVPPAPSNQLALEWTTE